MTSENELLVEVVNDEVSETVFKVASVYFLLIFLGMIGFLVMIIFISIEEPLLSLAVIPFVISLGVLWFILYYKTSAPNHLKFTKEGIIYIDNETNKIVKILNKDDLTMIRLRSMNDLSLEIGYLTRPTYINLASYEKDPVKREELGVKIIDFCSKMYPKITDADDDMLTHVKPKARKKDGTRI
jgi:hypothetical protein